MCLCGCSHSLCRRVTLVPASSRASGEGGRQDGVTTACQEGGHQDGRPHKEGGQTAAPTEKVSNKASPPTELSLEEQAIAQATADGTKKEMLVVKRCALEVANRGGHNTKWSTSLGKKFTFP